MRLFMSYIVAKSFLPKKVKFSSQPQPNGLAKYIDLAFLSNPSIYKQIRVIVFILLILYTLGLGLFICTLLLFIYILIYGTYNNSQGAVSHHNQVVCLIFLVQSIVYAAQLIGDFLDITLPIFNTYNNDQLAIFYSQQVIVAVYFTSALTKLINSKFKWFMQIKKIPIQLEKNVMQDYYNNLDPRYIGRIRSITDFLLNNPNLIMIAFSIGLFLEILSPLSLQNRLSNVVFGILMITFHKITAYVFRIHFYSFQRLLLIFFVNVPFLIHTMLYSYIAVY